MHLQGLTLILPQASWSCCWCTAVSTPLGPGKGVLREVVRKYRQINVC